MKKTLSLILFSITVLLVSSCTTRLTDYTLISTKNIDISQLGNSKIDKNRVIGEDKVHIILGIPTQSQILIQEAIDKAIESVPGGVALTDGVISYSGFWAVIYGQFSFIVEGNVLIDPEYSKSKVVPKFGMVDFDEEMNPHFKELTEIEYYNMTGN